MSVGPWWVTNFSDGDLKRVEEKDLEIDWHDHLELKTLPGESRVI